MATSLPDHFEGEDVIITFEENGKTTVTNFEGKINNFSFSGGSRAIELTNMFGGKTISFSKPREKFQLSFDFVTTDTRFQYVNLGGSAVWAPGVEIKSSASQSYWRVILWIQESSNHQTSGTVVVPSKAAAARRMIFVDCKSPEVTVDFSSEDMLKGTITLELTATDDAGYANVFQEYTTSTTPAFTTLTTTHRGTLTWNATTPAWTGAYST